MKPTQLNSAKTATPSPKEDKRDANATPVAVTPMAGLVIKDSPGTATRTPVAGVGASDSVLADEVGVRWSIQQRQGPRSAQEDRAVAKVDDRQLAHAYFGVFDGHGGSDASEYCAAHLHEHVLASPFMPHLASALRDAFLRADANMLHDLASRGQRKGWDAGTAAVVMTATASQLTLAHSGDCRAILVKRSSSSTSSVPFIELTSDHVAEYDGGQCAGGPDESGKTDGVINASSHGATTSERLRIEAAGGALVMGDYVCVDDHTLPMTRALGDLPLKVASGRCWRETPVSSQVVTALPEVRVHARQADDLCVVLASDGLFGNVMSSSEVAACARDHLEGANADTAGDCELRAARCLADRALCDRHGSDNVSVIVVRLEPPPQIPVSPPPIRVVEEQHAHLDQKLHVGFSIAYPMAANSSRRCSSSVH